jgi:hypothetical protein
MIRIQLVREGRVVKQISSRVHESVVLEQINKFKDPYDEIYIVEGDLSEDAKGMLKHVARKIVPAAMAAGLALGSHGAQADNKAQNYGNNGSPGLNRDFPALNYSPGQYLQQAVFNAQQRARGGDAAVSPQQPPAQYHQRPQATKVYDQSRVSQDGRFYIIYDMDNNITRVPVNGTDFMAGDSQRMPHYITQNGQVMYVRHPHNNGLGESAVNEGGFGSYYSEELAQKVFDQNPNLSTNGRADEYFDAAWPFMVADLGQKRAAAVINSEDFPMDTVSAYSHLQKQGVEEGMGTIGTTPTIPTSNSAPNPGNKPQFDKTGSTTNAKFNANGELELEDDEDGKLSPESIAQLKQAGVKVAESVDAGLQAILDQYSDAYAEFKEGGDLDSNPDFYQALFDYFSNMGEEDGGMPYGTQKARDGDPYEWMADKLDSLDHAPVVEGSKITEAPTDDPKFQKMMGTIQQGTPTLMNGYVAVRYASERPSKKISGATVSGKPVPATTEDPGRLMKNLKFTPDQIEQKLTALGQKYGWDRVEPGQGQGYTELFFDTSREYTSDTQRQLATNIVKTVNEINKFFASMNSSLQATGLPGYNTDVWQGIGPDNNINQIDDLNQITNIAQGKDAKADPGSAIGRMILKYIPEYEAENDELGYDPKDFANAKKVASIYIAKGERAGLQAQGKLDSHVSEMIDELLSDHGGSSLRTIWELDGSESVAENDDEATAADQGAADKNIIMQIRKASDYEKPLAIELADGNSITITAQTANKILAQFDRLKPASKELMQQTLNSQEGFREMLNYFNEREVNEDSISIAEQARARARLLIKGVFGV